jgi:hypothetical protein
MMKMPTDYVPVALLHAEKWFEIHAGQRLTLLQFYITILAVAIGLLVANINSTAPSGLIITGGFLCLLTLVFKLIDRRVSSLIKDAEWSIDALQTKIAEDSGLQAVRILRRTDARKQTSLRVCFNFLFGLGIIVAVFLIVRGSISL